MTTRFTNIVGMDRFTGHALTGMDHVRQSILDILATSLGSRICNRDYGSDLPNLVDTPMNDENIQRLFAATATAITTHYPQLTLTNIALNRGNDAGSLSLVLTGHESGAPTQSFSTALSLPASALLSV